MSPLEAQEVLRRANNNAERGTNLLKAEKYEEAEALMQPSATPLPHAHTHARTHTHHTRTHTHTPHTRTHTPHTHTPHAHTHTHHTHTHTHTHARTHTHYIHTYIHLSDSTQAFYQYKGLLPEHHPRMVRFMCVCVCVCVCARV